MTKNQLPNHYLPIPALLIMKGFRRIAIKINKKNTPTYSLFCFSDVASHFADPFTYPVLIVFDLRAGSGG